MFLLLTGPAFLPTGKVLSEVHHCLDWIRETRKEIILISLLTYPHMSSHYTGLCFFLKNFFILTWGPFFFYCFWRERKKREKGKHRCLRGTSIGCLPHTLDQRLNPQPRYVSRPGIKPETLQLWEDIPTN